jgi:hypothetical protein
MIPKPDLTSLLYSALEAEIGVSVVTNNPKLLRNQLYAERKREGLTELTFIQPPVDGETRLWIIKKEAKANGQS